MKSPLFSFLATLNNSTSIHYLNVTYFAVMKRFLNTKPRSCGPLFCTRYAMFRVIAFYLSIWRLFLSITPHHVGTSPVRRRRNIYDQVPVYSTYNNHHIFTVDLEPMCFDDQIQAYEYGQKYRSK